MFRKSRFLLRTDLFFALSILLFFLLIFLTINSAQDVGEGRALEERTYQIMEKLELMITRVVSLETDRNEYLSATNNVFPERLKDYKSAGRLTMDSLRVLVVDREQRQRLDTIEDLFQRLHANGDAFLSQQATPELSQRNSNKLKNEGAKTLDSLRSTVDRAIKKSMVLLAERSQATDKKRAIRGWYFIVLSGLAFVVMIVAYVITRATMRNLLVNKRIQSELIDELSYQNKQLDEFAHIVSHNIRGPAANVSALLSMISIGSPLTEYQLIFEKLDKVSKNLMETLNELLEILKVKKDNALEKKQIGFEQIFQKERENQAGTILKCSAELYVDFAGAPSVVYSHAYLESIIHNLVGNALKYRSPERSPKIYLKTEQKDGSIFLHVTDNGLGIDLDRFGDKIFGLRKTFHSHPEARGIGLFMTKTQVEAMGGSIEVRSKVGEGTTFTVRLT